MYEHINPARAIGPYEINVYDLAGDSTRFIADGANPSWAPDSKAIVYEFGYVIWRYDLTTATKAIIFSYGESLTPSLDPVTGSLAVATDYQTTRDLDIWTQTASWASPVNITQGRTGRNPVWSHDGKHILFFRQANESNLVSMDPTGNNEVALTPEGATDRDPAWSRDDKYIFWSHYPLGDSASAGGIWRANADGSGAQRIVQSGYHLSTAPLDTTVVYDRFDVSSNTFDLWIMGWNGENDRRLLKLSKPSATSEASATTASHGARSAARHGEVSDVQRKDPSAARPNDVLGPSSDYQ